MPGWKRAVAGAILGFLAAVGALSAMTWMVLSPLPLGEDLVLLGVIAAFALAAVAAGVITVVVLVVLLEAVIWGYRMMRK